MIGILITAYVSINFFFAGYYIGDPFNRNVWKFLMLLGFAIPYGILYFLAACWVAFWMWLDTWTYLPFWWAYYVTREYRNMKPDALASLNKRAADLPPGKKKDRWDYVLKRVNKINNYTWPSQSNES